MALTGVTIDWPSGVINVPRSDLTLVQSIPTEIREMDLNEFRLKLKELEETVDGMVFLKTHDHNTEILLGGITYARTIEILVPYTITFEDGQYAVNLVGANSNVGDRVNVNQVSVRSNNSAGLITSPEIEYAAFNGGVHTDLINGVAGTIYPRGTERVKSNNIPDTLLIADYRGFKKIYLYSDLNLDDTYDLENFTIIGESYFQTNITINSAPNISGATFENCTISGTTDGEITITSCKIVDLDNMSGQINNCYLNGTITLGGLTDSHIDNSSQFDFNVIPEINMGGSGQDLVVVNYTGKLLITNLTSNSVGIGLDAGQVILDSTSVTGGTIHVSGDGELIDENGDPITSGVWNGGVIVVNSLINVDNVAAAVWDEQISDHLLSGTTGLSVAIEQFDGSIHISNTGLSGTTFPIGTEAYPVNNINDAVLIGNLYDIYDLHFETDFTIDSSINISNFTLQGYGMLATELTFEAGCVVAYCQVKDVTVTGNMTGIIKYTNTLLKDFGSVGLVPSSLDLLMENCGFEGTLTLPSNYSGLLRVLDCFSTSTTQTPPTLDVGNSTSNCIIHNYSGSMRFINITQNNRFSILLSQGKALLDSSVTSANIIIKGVGDIVDNSGVGAVVDTTGLMSKTTITEAVWDEPISEHIISGSTGLSMAIQEYNGVVVVTSTGFSGTTYPIGTVTHPVNNIADAIVIANNVGTIKLQLDSTLTIESGTDVSGYSLSSSNNSTITILPTAITEYTTFTNLHLIGELGGYVIIENCTVGNITDFYGIMDRCVFNGDIDISTDNTKNAVFLDCYTGEVNAPPTIDCGGDGAKLSLRGLTGAALFTNKTGDTQPMFIDLYSARVGFNTGVTAGNITVRGVGYIYQDDSTNTTFSLEGLISKATISVAVWDEDSRDHVLPYSYGAIQNHLVYNRRIYFDPLSSISGTTFPNGTDKFPVNNWSDARLIAIDHGIRDIILVNSWVSDSSDVLNDYTFSAPDNIDTSIELVSGTTTKNTRFKNVIIGGVFDGKCKIEQATVLEVFNFKGFILDSVLADNIAFTDILTPSLLYNCGAIISAAPVEVDLDNATVSIVGWKGQLKLVNKTSVTTNTIEVLSGIVEIDATCTAGTINISGIGSVTDNSDVGCTVIDTTLNRIDISDTVWDEQLTGHTESGSAGITLSGSTATEVWNYPLP